MITDENFDNPMAQFTVGDDPNGCVRIASGHRVEVCGDTCSEIVRGAFDLNCERDIVAIQSRNIDACVGIQ